MYKIYSLLLLFILSIHSSFAEVPKETLRIVENEAKKGDIKAQVMLGIGYYLGKEIKQDYPKAKKWLTMASNKGNADAQLFLADMYLNGNGVEPNIETAINWLENPPIKAMQKPRITLGRYTIKALE